MNKQNRKLSVVLLLFISVTTAFSRVTISGMNGKVTGTKGKALT